MRSGCLFLVKLLRHGRKRSVENLCRLQKDCWNEGRLGEMKLGTIWKDRVCSVQNGERGKHLKEYCNKMESRIPSIDLLVRCNEN